MSPQPPSPVDAELWLNDQIHRGQHVVMRALLSYVLVHPGCARPCEFDGKDVKVPPADHPMYAAAIDKDGVVGPDHRATWEDVVAHERADSA